MSDQPPDQRQGAGFPSGGVFKAAVDAVVVMSIEGQVMDWNPAASALFGFSFEQAIGRELAELIIPAALRDKHRAALTRYRETGEATILNRRLHLFAIRANGSMVPVELTVTRIPDAEPPLFAGFVRERSGEDAEPA